MLHWNETWEILSTEIETTTILYDMHHGGQQPGRGQSGLRPTSMGPISTSPLWCVRVPAPLPGPGVAPCCTTSFHGGTQYPLSFSVWYKAMHGWVLFYRNKWLSVFVLFWIIAEEYASETSVCSGRGPIVGLVACLWGLGGTDISCWSDAGPYQNQWLVMLSECCLSPFQYFFFL